MRGSDTDTTSLDLLLDAICNTFGGIVFLAILLSLMLMGKTAKQKSQQDNPATTASAAEVRELLTELDEVKADYETLAATATRLPVGSGFDDGGQLQELLNTVTELQHTHDAWLGDNAELAKQLAEQLADNSELREDNETLAAELTSEAATATEMEQQLAAAVNAIAKNVALPRMRRSEQSRTLILFKGGRLYAAHRPALPGRDGFFRDQVKATEVQPKTYDVVPIEGRGVSAASPADVASFIDGHASATPVFIFAIWPDSFAQFAMLQEILVDRGIFYETWVETSGEPLRMVIGGTSSGMVQ